MKALVYTNPNEVTYRDEPDPVHGANEVVLKIDAASADLTCTPIMVMTRAGCRR